MSHSMRVVKMASPAVQSRRHLPSMNECSHIYAHSLCAFIHTPILRKCLTYTVTWVHFGGSGSQLFGGYLHKCWSHSRRRSFSNYKINSCWCNARVLLDYVLLLNGTVGIFMCWIITEVSVCVHLTVHLIGFKYCWSSKEGRCCHSMRFNMW